MKKTLFMGFVCLNGMVLAAALPAYAQQSPPASTLDPAQMLHQKTTLPPAAGFVQSSRPKDDQLGYIPLGGPRPEPATKVMTPEQVKAMERELDDLRFKQDKLAGRKSAPLARKSVTGEELRPSKGTNGTDKP